MRVQRIADRREQPLPGAFRESHVHPHRCPRKAFVRAVVERAGRLGGQVAHDRVGLVEDERLRGRQLLRDLARAEADLRGRDEARRGPVEAVQAAAAHEERAKKTQRGCETYYSGVSTTPYLFGSDSKGESGPRIAEASTSS